MDSAPLDKVWRETTSESLEYRTLEFYWHPGVHYECVVLTEVCRHLQGVTERDTGGIIPPLTPSSKETELSKHIILDFIAV